MAELPPQERLQLSEAEKANICFVSGEGNPELAAKVADGVGVEQGEITTTWHKDREPLVRIEETINEKHVVLFQSHLRQDGRSPSDLFMQTLGMIDSAAAGSPSRIILAVPYMFGARSDQEHERREAVFAKVAMFALKNLRSEEGVKRTILTIDHHAPNAVREYPSSFNISAQGLIGKRIKSIMDENPDEEYVVLSPDEGHLKAVRGQANKLGLDVIPMEKVKDKTGGVHRPLDTILGVRGKTAIMLDDMIDTAGTLISGAEVANKSGARKIIAAATHPVYSGDAVEDLANSPIGLLIVTDSIKNLEAERKLADKQEVISIADLVGQATITASTGRGSYSALSNGSNGR
jgi:ribose-phosphate pyrophosphokinase